MSATSDLTRCESCGSVFVAHRCDAPSPVGPTCECAHPASVHHASGGKGRLTFCTVWSVPVGQRRGGALPCGCKQFKERDRG